MPTPSPDDPQKPEESIPAQLGRYAVEQIDKAEVTVNGAVAKVRDGTNDVIGKAEEKLIEVNGKIQSTKNDISAASRPMTMATRITSRLGSWPGLPVKRS